MSFVSGTVLKNYTELYVYWSPLVPRVYLNGVHVGGVCVRNVAMRNKGRAVCNHTGGL